MNSSFEVGSDRLVEAGARRAQFFECLPVACYACDCAGTITDYNRRAVELWGRTPQATDRFTGAHKVYDAQGYPLAPEASATSFLIRSGLAQLNRELVIEKPDARRVNVLSNVTPLLNSEGKIVGALDVLQDITDRRTLEEARRIAERISASARVATEVARLKPALVSMVSLLDLLGQDATLSVQGRGYADLVRMELVRFDTLVKHMSHLSGAA